MLADTFLHTVGRASRLRPERQEESGEQPARRRHQRRHSALKTLTCCALTTHGGLQRSLDGGSPGSVALRLDLPSAFEARELAEPAAADFLVTALRRAADEADG